MGERPIVQRLRDRADDLDADDFTIFADEIGNDYSEAANIIERLSEALAHIQAEAREAQHHTDEPYYMQVVLEDIEATTAALSLLRGDGE